MPTGGTRTATNGPWKYWTYWKVAWNTVDDTDVSAASHTGKLFASSSITCQPCATYCGYDDSLIWNWADTDENVPASTPHTCGFSTHAPLLWIERLSASENCSA